MSNRNKILIGVAIVIVLLLSAIVFKETVLSKNKQDSGAVDSTTVADSTNETDSEEVEKAEGNDASKDDSKSTAKKTTDDKSSKKNSKTSDDSSDSDSSTSDSSTETAKSSGTRKSTGTAQPSGTGSTTTPSQATGTGSGTQSTDTTSTAAPAGTTDTTNTTNTTTPAGTTDTTNTTNTTTPADTTATTDTAKTTVPAETTNTTEAAESTANTTVPADTTANTTVPADTTEKAEASEPEEEENTGLLTDISGTIAAKPEEKTVEVTGVSLDKNSMDLYVGDALTLKETVSPDNATNREVTWSSSDSSVAAVNSDGTVTATGVGTTTITVSTSNNKIATCEVVVNTKVVEVSSVTLNISSSEMFVDDTVALSATVLPADATYKSVTWGSSDENVATVNGDGVVTAKGPGIATITASTLSGKAAACAITVSTKPIAVSSVTLDKETAEMTVEDTLTLTANVMPADADDKSVTWSSSNESILIVSDTGIVTAKAAGTATVTVTASNNMAAACDITVAEKVVPPTIVEVTSVSLDQTSASIFTDETVRLAAVVAPADATDKSVTWTSGDENIATVSGDGLVTPVATGNVTITVTTANGKTATCAVTISTRPVAVESISLDKTSMEMYAGDSATLAATVLPSDATDKSVMWTSNNARVATVSDTGAVSAEGVGTATITALTSNGKTAVCVISVKAKPIDVTSVALDKTSMDMYVDDSVTLSATISPADATDKSLTWTSGDSNIVTVSNTGSVKAKKAGTTTVTVTTANGKTATCSVTVKNKTVDVTSISVNTASATLKVNDTLSLSATVLPADATDKTVTWSSSAVLIAVVSNTGTVTAKSEGTAVITAKTANGKTATCTITVEKEEEEEEIEKDLNSLFKVPYIATYYFDFRPNVNDNIQIPLYLTDFEQSEYLKNDTTKTLDLIYEVDGVKKTIKNIPLGDYTLTIGKLSEGMHTFAVQALDTTTGMTSHKLYNELWVETSDTISERETYYMTSADLTTYDIHNNNSTNADDLISTRDGLSKLFADKQAAGYKKIVLLKGTYRINGANARKTCITIPSYFTVDMNGATFKLDTIDYETPGSIIFINDAIDAHLTNGTLEGDRFERQALELEYYPAGEGINAFYIYGGKYCSITNLTVKNNTGHSLMTQYNPYGVNITLNDFTRSIIVDGKEQASDSCSTSSMMDLTSILNFDPEGRYMYVGHPGGYKGIVGDSPVIYVSFYDENQNFLETVTGYQFRKMKIVDGAKYARITFLGTDFPSSDVLKSAHIYVMHNTDYFEASNITFIDTRTTCFAPTAVTNMLIQNCKYIRCSVGITPCQVDFEDGQEMCQDVYYMNNEVVENVKGNTCTLVDNIGYNHIFDGNINHSFEIRNRVIGGVFRNTNDETSFMTWRLGTKTRGGYGRIYNNTCCNIRFDPTTSDAPVEFRVKNCKIFNQADDKMDTNKYIVADAEKVTYENCEFPNFAGSNATFDNCTLVPANAIGNNLYFYNCTIGSAGVTSRYNLSNYENMNREFYNCHFAGQTEFNNGGLKSAKFTECVFDDLSMTPCTGNSNEALIFDKCTINSTYDKFLNIGPFAYSPASSLNIVFKDSVITHTGNNLIYSLARTSDGSQIYFENCTINKSSGNLFSGCNAVQEGDGLAVTFKSTDVDSGLTIDSKYLDSDSYIFTYED